MAGRRQGIPGIATVIRTFGDYGRWHLHLQAIVADGLFVERGSFLVMPEGDLRPCAELFRAYVLRMLRTKGLIDDSFIEMILTRKLPGIFLHYRIFPVKSDNHDCGNVLDMAEPEGE